MTYHHNVYQIRDIS